MKKNVLKVILGIIITAIVVGGGFAIYNNYKIRQVPKLSAADVLKYMTADDPKAMISVGIIKDGIVSVAVYGENGKKLPQKQHVYEIGSITKTFTASLVYKGVLDGLIHLDDSIDIYLSLPEDRDYPTVEELLTHTSGYKNYYFEPEMISNFLNRRNSFYGISKETVLERAATVNIEGENHDFHYSNFGFAVLGLVLESVYGRDYQTLMNDFIENDLGLTDTKISDGAGDLGNYWDWEPGDAYLSAGALTSNIEDMLTYAELQMRKDECWTGCHEERKPISKGSKVLESMEIRMDGIGLAWILDKENNIFWHNGGTGNFNSYLGFDPTTNTAVVVLSNLSPREGIPATVLGVKLMNERRSPDV